MSILNDTTPRLTRHLSDHHAVQGEAEYVERHAPVTASPGWQPIETAPRDGTAILASGLNHGKGPSRHYSVVEWMDFGCESGWYAYKDSDPHIYLTHWMPLPAAPEAEGGCDA